MEMDSILWVGGDIVGMTNDAVSNRVHLLAGLSWGKV